MRIAMPDNNSHTQICLDFSGAPWTHCSELLGAHQKHGGPAAAVHHDPSGNFRVPCGSS